MIDRPRYDAWLRDVLAKVRALPPPLGKWTGTPDVLGQVLRSDRLVRRGTWAEFGVADGSTLRRIAGMRGEARVWGFDSFAGLPEEWVRKDDVIHRAGHFAQDRIPKIPGAQLVVGWFEDTLPSWKPPAPVTLVHVDCDLGSATRCVFDHVAPMLAPGAFVAFDEALEYPGFEEHEILALYEAEQKGLRWEPVFAGGERLAIQVIKFEPVLFGHGSCKQCGKMAGEVDEQGRCRACYESSQFAPAPTPPADPLDPPEVDPLTGRDPGDPSEPGRMGEP